MRKMWQTPLWIFHIAGGHVCVRLDWLWLSASSVLPTSLRLLSVLTSCNCLLTASAVGSRRDRVPVNANLGNVPIQNKWLLRQTFDLEPGFHCRCGFEKRHSLTQQAVHRALPMFSTQVTAVTRSLGVSCPPD